MSARPPNRRPCTQSREIIGLFFAGVKFRVTDLGLPIFNTGYGEYTYVAYYVTVGIYTIFRSTAISQGSPEPILKAGLTIEVA